MNSKVFVAAAAVMLAAAGSVQAATVLDFEDVADGLIAPNQFTGVVIGGASVLTQDKSLNPNYPPHSGSKSIFDFDDGTITFDFTTDVGSFGAYVTGSSAITLSVYDGATLLGSVATPGANSVGNGNGLSPNIFLNLAFAHITSAVFTNKNNTADGYTLDDVTIGGVVTTNDVPEPATWAMMVGGFAVTGGALRRRKTRISFAA